MPGHSERAAENLKKEYAETGDSDRSSLRYERQEAAVWAGDGRFLFVFLLITLRISLPHFTERSEANTHDRIILKHGDRGFVGGDTGIDGSFVIDPFFPDVSRHLG